MSVSASAIAQYGVECPDDVGTPSTHYMLSKRTGESNAHPQERAWSEGHKAGKNDRLRTSCPYNKGMMQRAWLGGWGEGHKSKKAEGRLYERELARGARQAREAPRGD